MWISHYRRLNMKQACKWRRKNFPFLSVLSCHLNSCAEPDVKWSDGDFLIPTSTLPALLRPIRHSLPLALRKSNATKYWHLRVRALRLTSQHPSYKRRRRNLARILTHHELSITASLCLSFRRALHGTRLRSLAVQLQGAERQSRLAFSLLFTKRHSCASDLLGYLPYRAQVQRWKEDSIHHHAHMLD